MRDSRFGKLGWVCLSVLVFVADQASKYWFSSHMSLFQRIEVIPGLFDWTLAYNSGAAFSFLAGASGWQRWLFSAIALAVSLILLLWLKRLKPAETGLAVALALVLGGALGNLFDRMAFGQVIDFVLLHWQNRWYFPAFNLADSAITVGALLLLLDMLKGKGTQDEVERD
jgi:signal peptidase II